MSSYENQLPIYRIIEVPGAPAFQHMPFHFDDIRRWRLEQAAQGEPASLQDFFRPHECCLCCFGSRQQCRLRRNTWLIGSCPRCGGSGKYTAYGTPPLSVPS